MRRYLKGIRFANVTTVPAGIEEDEFERYYQHWNEYLNQFIGVNGEYYEIEVVLEKN